MKYLLAIFKTRMHVNRSLWRAFTSQRITALLMVNAENVDFLKNDEHYALLLKEVQLISSGRHYFNPVLS